MGDHDHAYKLLFSHAEMVRDLLEGFIKEPWLREVDYESLERVAASYVSEDLRERSDDVVWRSVILRRTPRGPVENAEDLGVMGTRLEARMDEWEQNWLRQGLEQGRREGEAQLLRRLLEQRFGELPDWVGARLQDASPAQIERWAERLLAARSLESLFDGDDH